MQVSEFKREKKPSGKPFSKGFDARRSPGGVTNVKKRIAEATNACNQVFLEEMFKEVDALQGNEVVKTTPACRRRRGSSARSTRGRTCSG